MLTNPVIDNNGTQCWYLDGKYHRVDVPAVIDADGSQYLYLNDKRHRVDGPAAIYADGSQYWYLDDKEYNFKDFCVAAKISYEDELILRLKYNC